MTFSEWEEFLLHLTPEEIVWRVPWLDLPDMTIHSAGFGRVVILGTSGFTFYIPGRFLRQLGVSQGRTRAGIEDFEIPPFTVQRAMAFQRRWGNRELVAADPEFFPGLDSSYLTWLHRDLAERERNNINNSDSD